MAAALVALLALLFGVYVWPTAYRSLAVDLSAWPRAPQGSAWSDVTPLGARENRFTGAVDILTTAGWLRVSDPHAIAANRR